MIRKATTSLLLVVTANLSSMAIVREREIGTLEQLMVSPLSPAELILGKTVPVIAIAFIQMTIIVTVALLWFRIPFEGSFLLLLASAFFYILSGLGLGLLYASFMILTWAPVAVAAVGFAEQWVRLRDRYGRNTSTLTPHSQSEDE